MSSKVALTSAVVLFVCSSLVAQLTVPATMNGVEGGSGTNVPFGSNLACRYQCLYDAHTLPWTGPRLISGLKLRADNGSPTTPGAAIAAKGYLVISVLVSTTAVNAANASATFDDNRGVDRQWVLQNHHLQLPAQAAIAAGPRVADIDLPFTTPWWYGLTPAHNNQPAPANLLVEIWILSQPSGPYRIDNLGGCQAAVTTFGNQGPLCVEPSQPPPLLTSDPSMIAGGTFAWYVDNGPANAPFILAFSAAAQGVLFGNAAYPLPYPMFDTTNPALPSAAFAAAGLNWSAPDCWINVVPQVNLFGTCDASGHGAVVSTLPSGGHLVGFELFAQALIYAQTANALQVISTGGRSSTVCGPIDVARIFAFYDGTANPPPPPPSSGAAQYGLGMVFDVQ